AGDVSCEYEVFEKFEVTPDQVSVLAQQYDKPYLTLITCTPPGTVLRRLIVNARLKSLPTNNQY
ncbi:MAG: sortase domain-bontaining protein, partial [Candidatus Roizmanbacteria bacterium]